MNDLSIIIVNTNNKKLLEECLTSIYQNTRKIALEIIVSDNASTDGSQSMVKAKFPQVKLIENKENLGFIKASNLGLKAFSARYAMLLNDDTVVKADALERLVEFMDKHPEAGACGPKLLNTDGSVQHQGGLFGKRFWLAKEPTAVDFVIGAALLVRNEVIDRVGIMDENLFFYNDDLDWCLSIRKAGWKIYFVPDAEIIHYGGYSSKRTFNRRLFVEGFKGGLYFCRKHYGELAYNIYRLCLCFGLSLCLPFHFFNKEKLSAYSEIIGLAWHGQIPRPMLK
ncbi:MAG: glycosyltransferase family 2 protein [Candidatus Margulisbacteria bacterium]|nr:glycosyltransferase family 2 protein [Candidatus Margulisiibacteriota bacterium]